MLRRTHRRSKRLPARTDQNPAKAAPPSADQASPRLVATLRAISEGRHVGVIIAKYRAVAKDRHVCLEYKITDTIMSAPQNPQIRPTLVVEPLARPNCH